MLSLIINFFRGLEEHLILLLFTSTLSALSMTRVKAQSNLRSPSVTSDVNLNSYNKTLSLQ